MLVQGTATPSRPKGTCARCSTTPATEARKTPVQSTSEQLVARKNDRRIELVGKVTIVDETRTLKSEKATFFLDANRKIQRMEAETNVNVVEAATRRKGTGDKAVYQVDKKMIYLNGKPATISDPQRLRLRPADRLRPRPGPRAGRHQRRGADEGDVQARGVDESQSGRVAESAEGA